jgi:hypothetical protein
MANSVKNSQETTLGVVSELTTLLKEIQDKATKEGLPKPPFDFVSSRITANTTHDGDLKSNDLMTEILGDWRADCKANSPLPELLETRSRGEISLTPSIEQVLEVAEFIRVETQELRKKLWGSDKPPFKTMNEAGVAINPEILSDLKKYGQYRRKFAVTLCFIEPERNTTKDADLQKVGEQISQQMELNGLLKILRTAFSKWRLEVAFPNLMQAKLEVVFDGNIHHSWLVPSQGKYFELDTFCDEIKKKTKWTQSQVVNYVLTGNVPPFDMTVGAEILEGGIGRINLTNILPTTPERVMLQNFREARKLLGLNHLTQHKGTLPITYHLVLQLFETTPGQNWGERLKTWQEWREYIPQLPNYSRENLNHAYKRAKEQNKKKEDAIKANQKTSRNVKGGGAPTPKFTINKMPWESSDKA